MTVVTIAATTIAGIAGSAGAAQRIDMRVLLLSGTGAEPAFTAWQAQLRREGVPFDAIVARPGHAPITSATLSRTLPDGTQEARYQAVIVSLGGLPCGTGSCLSASEWSALAGYEQTFHVRRLTAYTFPGPDYGLTAPAVSGLVDGQTATLTASGLQTFPYLKGPVTMATGTWAYQSRPLAGARFDTLLTGPNDSSLLGVFTRPDGREEMVQTFDGNQFQLHSWLLRHGELAWVTRGTYLGEQRNYLELQVDDVFLPDDAWDVARRTTNYDPAAAIRMTAADVTAAVNWADATGLRMDMVYNGGGSAAQAAANGSDPLLGAFQAVKDRFNWVNHTWDHPNLDCSTRAFIAAQIRDNTAWAQQTGLPVDARELVTGEHSGLANLVPGNPGTIDPPSLDQADALDTGGTLAAGTYDYAVTGLTSHGETVGSTAAVTTTGATGATALAWDAICHATGYRVYRRVSPAGAWSLIGTVAHPANAFTDAGPVPVTFTDTGAAGSAGAPPAVNAATVDPYAQNPSFAGALQDTGVTAVASDASKPYPQTPTSLGGPQWPAGASFVDGSARAVPRYPTNVYYNVATQEQLLSEYNHLYLPPPDGVCVNTAVTTCESAPVTWPTLVQRESDRIFGHMMGNDPRPHYFHQSNIAQTGTPGGGVLYPVLDATLADYRRFFAANAPIVQLRHAQIADQLARQDTWSGAGSGQVSGWIQGYQVTLMNASGSAVQVPLSGTEVGDLYGGMRSGWTTAGPGTSVHRAATVWPGTVTPTPPQPPVTPPAPPARPPQPPAAPPPPRPVVHAPSPAEPPPPPAAVGPPSTRGGPGRTPRARRARRRVKRCGRKAKQKKRLVRTPHGKRRRAIPVRRGCKPRPHRHGAKHRRPAAKQRRGT